MLHFFQSIKTAVTILLANKVRSFLTMLGIIIGVGAVIVIMAVGAGAQSLIVNQVKSLGTDLVGVLPGKSEEDGPPASAMGIVITTLTYEDAMALKKKANSAHITDVVAYVKAAGSVSWGANSYDTTISGVTSGYIPVEKGEVESGRFITEDEERGISRVVVLGSTVKEEVFGETDPLGQRVKIGKQTYEVVGVMKERGTVAFQNYDDQVFIPLKTVQKLISGINHISIIRAKVDDEKNVEQAIADIETTLRERHNIDDPTGADDDFTARSAAQALDIITSITDALKYFLAAMAAISLVVGGIGIMNIMLVAITERTREIGLRKAVGANTGDIMRQFLLESIVITSIGGIIGIIGGVAISYLVAIVANALEYDWAFEVTISSVLAAISVSVGVGLVFGIYPARKASRLEPIEALRYE